MNNKDQYRMWKEAGVDLKSFHQHKLTLIPVDDGTFQVGKITKKSIGSEEKCVRKK